LKQDQTNSENLLTLSVICVYAGSARYVKDVPVSKIVLNSKSIRLFPTDIPVIEIAYVGLEIKNYPRWDKLTGGRHQYTRRKTK
jgi:hypothetical protein